jgi:hypothetical protein
MSILPIDDDDVLLSGGRAIGAALNFSAQKAFRLLEQGKIRSAKKRDGRWIAWRRQLRAEFGIADTHQREAGNGKSVQPEA